MTERRDEINQLLADEYRVQAELDGIHSRLDQLLGGVAVEASASEPPKYRAYGNLIVLRAQSDRPEPDGAA
jgi:hypothetical protein